MTSRERLAVAEDYPRGRPSPRVAMTLCWISEVPAETVIAEALRTGNLRLASRALNTRHTIPLAAGRPNEAQRFGRESYRLARGSGDVGTIARATAAIGNARWDTSLPRGLRWVKRGIRLGETVDDFPVVSWTGIRVALGIIELGNLVAAERIALRIMHMDAGLHRLRPLPRSHSVLRTVYALRGLPRDERSPAVEFWHGWEPLDVSHALAQEAVARYSELMVVDHARGAYEAVSIVIDQFLEVTGCGRFLVVDLIPRQLESAIAMRDLDAAARAIERFEEAQQVTEDFAVSKGEYHHARGRLAAARSEALTALDELATAERIFEQAGYTWRRCQVLVDIAETHMAMGQTEFAGPCLDEAHSFFTTAGADLSRVRRLYRQAGRRAPRRRGSGDLSEREMEVERLVARGLTDAEIGVSLGIRRRTVTTHVHNILSKRGVHSRIELRDHAQ